MMYLLAARLRKITYITLKKSFLTLRRAGLKLKPKKCNFFQTEVHYLGNVINKSGIRPRPQKLAAARTWERSKTVTHVRLFTASVTIIENS